MDIAEKALVPTLYIIEAGRQGWIAVKKNMHEMSVAESILRIAEDELEKRGLRELIRVRVCYGALSRVVGESLHLCFEALLLNTPYKGAVLELEELPVVLRCGVCGRTFSPQDGDMPFSPCPACGENFGHHVEQGRELYVKQLEAQ